MVRRSLLVLCGVGTLLSTAMAAEPHPPPAILQLALWPTVQLASPDRDVMGLRLIALHGKNQSLTGLDFALGLAESEGSMDGLGVSGWLNVVNRRATGLQVAVAGNGSEGLYGCQVAGLGNDAGDTTIGIQVASLVNAARVMTGVQASGVWNVAESVTGLQLAGIDNSLKGMVFEGALPRVAGVQIAGLTNTVPGASEGNTDPQAEAQVAGAQISGLANIVEGKMTGLQAAGLSNTAEGNLYGVQLAALYNSARAVRGLQIGLINRCDDLRGVQIGLINIRSGSRFPFVPLLNFRF